MFVWLMIVGLGLLCCCGLCSLGLGFGVIVAVVGWCGLGGFC